MTISDKLLVAHWRPAGFDYLRIFLAFCVVFTHIFGITLDGDVAKSVFGGLARPLEAFILPMFFSLSGFLVAGSLVRSETLVSFFGLRVLRLLPALAVEIMLSAFVIGPLFTQLPLREYFTQRGFYTYFLNLVGRIHYELPGVFTTNTYPNIVNQQLWTIPWELDCYILLGLASVLGLIKLPRIFLAGVVAVHFLFLALHGADFEGGSSVQGYALVLSFLAGVAIFLFKDRLPWSPTLGAISAIAIYLLLLVPYGDNFVSAPAAYFTVFLGVTNPSRARLLLSGDYSYGLYLYGFPIQQAFASIWPGLNISALVAVFVAMLFACFSWWCVELPTLKLRSFLPKARLGEIKRRESPVPVPD